MSWRPFLLFGLICCLLAPGSAANAYTYHYEVLPGDSLISIAKRYRTTVSRLRRHNRLRSNRIRAGTKIKIITPAVVRQLKKRRYTVRRGDTLAGIAQRRKIKLVTLQRLNPRAARRKLRPGQQIWVVALGKAPLGRRVKGLMQLTSGPGYVVRDLNRAWATFLTATRLDDVLSRYAETFAEAPPVKVMDVSRENGGYFPPHASHQEGRDVDIRYPLLAKHRGVRKARPGMLDLQRTWFLIKSFIDTGDIVYIFMDRRLQGSLYRYALAQGESKRSLDRIFQYPRRRGGGIIRHDPGHRTHFHVRFRPEKKPAPPRV